MFIVARRILRSRCDGVRPRRIVQHLQGFGFGPFVGGLLRKGHSPQAEQHSPQRRRCKSREKKKLSAWPTSTGVPGIADAGFSDKTIR